jgi:aerobic carbon-monoxide dehydrogenase large subunit
VCFDRQFDDAGACRRMFDCAAHVARISLRSPRVAAMPIEPRAALGIHDALTDSYTLVTNTQGVHFVRRVLRDAFGWAPRKLRVVTPHVGGGFGPKIFCLSRTGARARCRALYRAAGALDFHAVRGIRV